MAQCPETNEVQWNYAHHNMKLPVYTKENKAVGEIEVSDAIFGRAWNPTLVHQIIVALAANRRAPIAHTKDRSEVSGGGRKPWRQKGTGRARHGSSRSPLWKGGGTTFGPRNERDFSQKINKKMARAALYCALSKKLADGEMRIIDDLTLARPKTKELHWIPHSALLVPAADNRDIYRASANLPKVKTMYFSSLNAEDVIKYKNIFIDQKAVPQTK